jgi:hypothetical protein
MRIIYSDMTIPEDNTDVVVFLAGPTPREKGVPSWRPDFLHELEKSGFGGTVLVPERSTGTDYDYLPQVKWEEEGLEVADFIIFWVPRNLDNMPGFTTNIEFGEWMKSGKCILGFPEGAPGMRYMEYKSKKYDIPVFDNMTDMCKLLNSWNVGGIIKEAFSYAKYQCIVSQDYFTAALMRDFEVNVMKDPLKALEFIEEKGLLVTENLRKFTNRNNV